MILKPNITRSGRIARAITGSLTLVAALVVWFAAWPSAPVTRACIILALVVAGLFQLYEARRSWCVMRACGVRTPM
jgi:hypothetical protein